MSSGHISRPLPQGFPLDGYRIERLLSQGGFSMVYLARDQGGAPVAIKEYLPFLLARRTGDDPVPTVAAEDRAAFNQGMKCFFQEARLLAHIDHPNVVRVLNFFRANETAYMVMRYESGNNLKDHVQRLQAHGAAMQENVLRQIFVHLLNGLREVHRQRLLHLDIKPANIYLNGEGQPVLLDFGASRHGLGENRPVLAPVHTPGFAAPEQEGSGEAVGPWTDIYSIGATLYACLAGNPPPPATARMEKDELNAAEYRWRGRYSPQLLELIDWCLKLKTTERPQSVFALQKVLNGELLDLTDPSWFASPSAGGG